MLARHDAVSRGVTCTTDASLWRDSLNSLPNDAPIDIFAKTGWHHLHLMRWGLVPAWAKDPSVGVKLINARAEGIAKKPSFKRPLRTQPCLLPASAFL